MQRALDVGIIGAGFAGCAAATFLSRRGHRVTLYERVEAPEPVGAGILLQPTGMSVLARLGVAEAMLARGARVDMLRATTPKGRRIFELRYGELGPELFGVGSHRGALFELLFGAARAAGARFSGGSEIEAIEGGDQSAQLLARGGQRVAEHDLAVVADGARSQLRARSPLLARARRYPWGALWFVGADPEERFSGSLTQICQGTRKMLGFLPTGRGPGAGDTPLVSLFWSLRIDEVEDWRRAGLGPWKREILDFAPHAEPLLDQIRDVDQVLTAEYVDGVMRRFHEPSIAYVGDAAHSMSPQLGQGTNLALMDAATLADALDDEQDLSSALADYSRRRRRHVRFYQWASRWLTPFFQSGYSALSPARDLGFPILARIPPLRMQMTRSLAGVKRGVLRRSMPVQPLAAALAPPPKTAELAPAPRPDVAPNETSEHERAERVV